MLPGWGACALFNQVCERSEPLIEVLGFMLFDLPRWSRRAPRRSSAGTQSSCERSEPLIATATAGAGVCRARAEGRLRPAGAGRGLAP